MKSYAKFGYAASLRFRITVEKPQWWGQNHLSARATSEGYLLAAMFLLSFLCNASLDD